MNITAQKVQGVAHWLNHRSPCEDAGMVRRAAGVCVAAICDGASCCRAGRQTAEALCSDVTLLVLRQLRAMMRMDAGEIRRRVLQCIRQAQHRVAASCGCALWDCGCTLSLVAVDTRRGTYLAIQLGDGGIVGQRATTGELRLLCRPDKGQSAHATWLTVHPDADILEHLQIRRGAGLDAFFLMSDGLEGVFYAANGEVAGELAGVLDALRITPDAGKRLIQAIALSPYQPEDDVSFAAMAGCCCKPSRPLPRRAGKLTRAPQRTRQRDRQQCLIAESFVSG